VRLLKRDRFARVSLGVAFQQGLQVLQVAVGLMFCQQVGIFIPLISEDYQQKQPGTSAGDPQNNFWICTFRRKANVCDILLCLCGAPRRCAMEEKTSLSSWH
tara:strand:+ start:93 stop:398 length:306 start_codon:yes stop_codon:yes gene_type:complete